MNDKLRLAMWSLRRHDQSISLALGIGRRYFIDAFISAYHSKDPDYFLAKMSDGSTWSVVLRDVIETRLPSELPFDYRTIPLDTHDLVAVICPDQRVRWFRLAPFRNWTQDCYEIEVTVTTG